MRIPPTNFQLPMHIARAYGVRAASPIAPPNASQQIAAGQSNPLVAGNVARAVNFDASPSATSSAAGQLPVFQMYTRAADRIEAATAIQIGRAIDVTG